MAVTVTGKLRRMRPWLMSILVMLGTATVYHAAPNAPLPLAEALSSFPMTVGEWRGEAADLEQQPVRAHSADEEIARVYRNATGDAVRLYIAYFESQGTEKKVVSYLSEDLHRNAVEIELIVSPDERYRVNRVTMNGRRHRGVVVFWYDIGGSIVANRYLAKLRTVMEALAHRRTNAAMVAVAFSPSDPAAHSGREFDLLFLQRLVPAVQRHLRQGSA